MKKRGNAKIRENCKIESPRKLIPLTKVLNLIAKVTTLQKLLIQVNFCHKIGPNLPWKFFRDLVDGV